MKILIYRNKFDTTYNIIIIIEEETIYLFILLCLCLVCYVGERGERWVENGIKW